MPKEFNYHTRVMGCDFDMTFIAQDSSEADQYFIEALEVVKFYEEKFSRFSDESELSKLNSEKSIVVTEEFLNVYNTALKLCKKTNGKFNPLLQVEQVGYNQSFEKINHKNSPLKPGSLQYNKKMDDILVDGNVITLQKDQKLDFGGFLKGYVAEIIGKKLNECKSLIINIGGDLFVKGADINNENFTIEIEHPFDNKKNVFLSISNKALCTSGTYKRKWNSNNKIYHHILEEVTNKSTETDIISASIIHDSGAYADAYATYAISLGSEKAKNFLSSENIDFVIMCENGAIIKSNNL